jgi:hypothetical protein
MYENERRLRPELWRQRNWLLHYDNAHSQASFFTREFLTKKNVSVVPPPTLLFFVSLIENKSEGRHFDTIEVIEAESEAVLNTLIEQDFQDAFKKLQKHWERCIRAERGYFKGGGGQ